MTDNGLRIASLEAEVAITACEVRKLTAEVERLRGRGGGIAPGADAWHERVREEVQR